MTIAADAFRRRDTAEFTRWTTCLLIVIALHCAALLLILRHRVPFQPVGAPPAAVIIDLAPAPPAPSEAAPPAEPTPTAAGAVGAARARAGACGRAEPDAAPRGGPTTAAATQAQAESQAGRAPTGAATRACGGTRTCCGSARALPGTGQSSLLDCQCSGDVAGTTSRLARKAQALPKGRARAAPARCGQPSLRSRSSGPGAVLPARQELRLHFA